MGQLEDNEKPVFLINGFLDGGKTSFINFTISEEYFHIDENTFNVMPLPAIYRLHPEKGAHHKTTDHR